MFPSLIYFRFLSKSPIAEPRRTHPMFASSTKSSYDQGFFVFNFKKE